MYSSSTIRRRCRNYQGYLSFFASYNVGNFRLSVSLVQLAESEATELEKHGNTIAKIHLGDVPSSLCSLRMADGGVDDGGYGGEEVEDEDPLEVFGSGIMMIILSKLDASSVALARLVSRRWLAVASRNRIWAPKCEELWQGKAHIPRISKVQGLSKMAAYSLSVTDAKRTRITRNDLCDHTWEFRFTEAAPEFWRNLDPYWRRTGTPMHRYFHQDGSITADLDDTVWGGHESCYTIVTSLLGDNKIREHYVRINKWPQMTVKRKEDWGWELANHLYCYTSVPDAGKEDGTGPFFPVLN